MAINRRDFIRCGLCAAAALALPTPIRAWTRAPGANSAGRTLVLLHLEGGNDGLSTVVPYAHPRYGILRPTLARRGGDVLPIDAKIGLNSNLSGLKTLLDRDQLAIVLGAGYPNPNFSHFRATEIWHSAEPDRSPSQGWVGRFLDSNPKESPVRAVSLGNEPPLVLASQTVPALTIQSFSRFKLPKSLANAESMYAGAMQQGGATGDAAAAGTAAIRAARKLSELEPSRAEYGGGNLANTLKKVAAICGAGIDVEVISCAFGGFDTHVGQRQAHDNLMQQLGRAVLGFQDDLKARGIDDRVLLLIFSEFGRRPEENASGGTDHGAAAPVFLVGKKVRKGVYGEQSPLEDLDQGNLRNTVDFRQVYASILRDWMGVDPKPLIGAFDPLPLLA